MGQIAAGRFLLADAISHDVAARIAPFCDSLPHAAFAEKQHTHCPLAIDGQRSDRVAMKAGVSAGNATDWRGVRMPRGA